jgi:type II secretory pathway predicted ATPase ExeA
MRGLATIAAMPKRLRVILAAAIAASSLGLAACGDEGTEPSIPPDAAQTLLDDLGEIQANIDVDSCFAASTRVDALVADIQALPPSVDEELKRNLEASAERLQTLLSEGATEDPACTDDTEDEPTTTEETTTEEPTTTEETTKEETTTEEPTTTEETTTTPPTTTPGPPGGSGGIGPG